VDTFPNSGQGCGPGPLAHFTRAFKLWRHLPFIVGHLPSRLLQAWAWHGRADGLCVLTAEGMPSVWTGVCAALDFFGALRAKTYDQKILEGSTPHPCPLFLLLPLPDPLLPLHCSGPGPKPGLFALSLSLCAHGSGWRSREGTAKVGPLLVKRQRPDEAPPRSQLWSPPR